MQNSFQCDQFESRIIFLLVSLKFWRYQQWLMPRNHVLEYYKMLQVPMLSPAAHDDINFVFRREKTTRATPLTCHIVCQKTNHR
mmetsp:Transcript_37797/g.113038  ORF Transcript_37797/g.113038 Transcript_37797/m.113038 type:complete len:84 (-) Transcript_37797:667-918(-)